MIACVQMKLRAEDYRSEESFRARIMEICAQVREVSGDEQLLIVFPEHIGTFCLLCNAPERVWSQKTFAQASAALLLKHAPRVLHHMLVHRVSPVRALFLTLSTELERIYLGAFTEAAKEYEAWIAAGSATLRWGQTKRVFNTAPLITPLGHVFYRQHKVNLVDMEGREGLDLAAAPLNYVSAVQSPFGNLGIAICLDAFSQDVRHRLRDLGSEILLQPSANNGPWNDWQQEDWLRSSYEAVVTNGEFRLAVNPMLVGSLWDLEFEGQSSIIDHQGYVDRAKTHNEEEILFRKGFLD
ncbi:MAG: carbon-nitrogen hydrolase family protein [Firmicutes bacterium]|nr:carbon-nitrogen hydrolase family protein [Bacillota bacterium]